MGISVEHAFALLLLLPWAAFTFWMIRTAARLTGARRTAAIAIRSVILLIVVLILAQIQPYRTIEQRNVVFLADRSASMKDDERVGQWIAEAWRTKAEDDSGGIVSFGQHAVVDRGLSKALLPEGETFRFRTGLKDGYTDLAKGLQLGAAMLRDHGGGRIVLLSDGSQNSGDALRAARMLKDSGIRVDVVNLALELARDAALDELKVPAALKQGETFSFEIAIQSTFAGAAELRIYQNDQQLSASDVRLEHGENRFVLQSTALEPGFHRFRAEVYAGEDGRPANNSAYAFSRVSGPPNVLIVEGVPGSSANLESALASSVIGFDTIGPEQLSMELAEYAAYDSIILNNVPATRIAEKPMEWLGKSVSDYGVGLMMMGGEEAFGLGGYFQTPVEDALPVYMDLKGRKKLPSLGLVLVIDRSGSMMDGKLELAKEAAMRTVELMREEDTVGVVAFDSLPWWVVEPTKLSDREAVLEKIQGIQAEGGTEIYSALDEGYRGLLEIEAERKHMILLTDGQSSTSNNYAVITDAMNERMMTLSTVAVGEGSDQALLKRLADNAKGRYYFTKDQSTLPAIFSRETVLMSRTYVVDGEFVPAIGDAGDWSSLWKDGVPPLQAYIATTQKELAEVALWSPEGDPILARWNYGSGRTVAWTSDANGKWSSDWVKWPSFPKVFTEWVKWTFPGFDGSPYRVEASMAGGEGMLTVETDGESVAGGKHGLGAKLEQQSAEYGSEPIRLMPVAPGRYEAAIGELEPGAYLARIGELADAEGTGLTGGQAAGFVIPYSPEYRIGGGEGAQTLAKIAAITGGRELRPEDALLSFRGEKTILREPYDWTREMLILALLLWLLDIAVRRLSIPWRALSDRILGRIRSNRLSGAVGSPAPETASVLAQLKKRANASKRFYGGDDAGRAHNVPPNAKSEAQDAGGYSGRHTAASSPIAGESTRSTMVPNGVPSKPGPIPPSSHGAADAAGPSTVVSRGSGGNVKPKSAKPPVSPQVDSSKASPPSAPGSVGGEGTMNRLLAAKNRSNKRG
ncbi:VWA domain-containing protein [Paenibacillus sp. LHD-117]|uniref:VWA domain-containing protein n=1 Tax=Paenibacillus sp. LHD-117 TaxID=3071412 RepID=UPI0027E1F970|nr:VWA domain-containing protein [Paenibacillus sp. LHD-117]MDQ6419147.1 VWA domain-containing protein [Paenibacillus sp. LHD-117]